MKSGIPYIDRRRDRIARAISYLRGRCIPVEVLDRHNAIRRYRVNDTGQSLLADELIDLAISYGMEPDAA